jgi:hypothetical protein
MKILMLGDAAATTRTLASDLREINPIGETAGMRTIPGTNHRNINTPGGGAATIATSKILSMLKVLTIIRPRPDLRNQGILMSGDSPGEHLQERDAMTSMITITEHQQTTEKKPDANLTMSQRATIDENNADQQSQGRKIGS